VSADIEPTADLASAGLVARTLDGDAGISVHAHAHGPCAHAVFALYSISFMSLWIVLVEPVSSVKALAGLVPFLLLVPFLHVFMQLKETYQLGIAAAGWRTSALGFATTLAGVFYFLLVLLVTFH
jgi:hypothetical protein